VSGRERRIGVTDVRSALERGDPVQRIVLRRGARGAAVDALVAAAETARVPVQRAATQVFDRLRPQEVDCDALALVGPPLGADLDGVLDRGGALWLLTGTAYPGNAGFVMRTAEVSGAAGVCIDASFGHKGRREALRTSMRADRFMPVLWERTDAVLDAAAAHGHRIVAIEDVGAKPPWSVDLTGPVLFVVGGEADGIPAAALARCDEIVRIPMAGFLRAYNLQAAVAAVAVERLRQLPGAA
jgi:tRNA G18 (ribose-2'-O)-methylase SpoU